MNKMDLYLLKKKFGEFLTMVVLLIFCSMGHSYAQVTDRMGNFYLTDTDNDTDAGRDVAVDANGNVYVTGESASSGTGDLVTIKYDTNGNQLWVARHTGPGTGRAITLDNVANVYITGEGPGSDGDFVTIKYDTNGNEIWTGAFRRALS